MATYPATPIPQNTGLPASEDQVYKAQFDGGPRATRPKYLTPRDQFVLEYITGLDDYRIFQNFVRVVRGGALTFDWEYPWGETVIDVKDTTPIGIETANNHGLQTGHQVRFTNVNPAIDGTVYTVTVLDLNDFTLDGTTASGTVNNGGTVARYFPKMRLLLPGDTLPAPTKLDGPPHNGLATVQYTLTLEEDF